MISMIADVKWNLGFLENNIQSNLLKTTWERLSFVEKELKKLKELKAYHLLLRTTPD